MSKLYVAFLWHMHQPLYKDRLANRYHLPWVRLHSLFGYYEMPALLKKFPKIKATFNLTTVLLSQMEDYQSNEQLKDDFLAVSKKQAARLTPMEKEFLLTNFFMINWDRVIKPHLRYSELLNKRGIFDNRPELINACQRFETQDFLDLQVLFNLSWFGHAARSESERLEELIQKKRFYTEEEKNEVLNLQKEVLSKVISLYRSLSDEGRAELSTSPFYHPILPLLWNGGKGAGYGWEEDARAQVNRGKALFQRIFGREPKGMWPSEGSVSESIIPVFSDHGIRWIATDEDILFHSIPEGKREDLLYEPHWAEVDGKRLVIFFRDRVLSDLIGFSYARMPAERAADDFLRRLYEIKKQTEHDGLDHVVSIILDGENPWDSYPEGGTLFLEALYERLSRQTEIETICFSEYLERYEPRQVLKHLYAGSWINHNFNIWYGHEEDFAAWDCVKKTREFLMKTKLPDDVGEKAWEELYAAEGSDWFWWFGDDFETVTQDTFDFLFRNHLSNVYRLAGKRVPAFLKNQIKRMKHAKARQEPNAFITPILDGQATAFYEWLNAGHYAVDEPAGAMQRAVKMITAIYYGFDLEYCYLRIDLSPELKPEDRKELRLLVHLHSGIDATLDCALEPSKSASYRFCEEKGDEKLICGEFPDAAVGKIVEIKIPFSRLQASKGRKIDFSVAVERQGVKVEEWPHHRTLSFEVPDEHYEDMMWNA